jgi:hypothetical protein
MSCDHGLTQIIVENGMVFKETRKLTPCPICMIERIQGLHVKRTPTNDYERGWDRAMDEVMVIIKGVADDSC